MSICDQNANFEHIFVNKYKSLGYSNQAVLLLVLEFDYNLPQIPTNFENWLREKVN